MTADNLTFALEIDFIPDLQSAGSYRTLLFYEILIY